jgi:p-aminobenzoyl-glutamate transporter AbgT
MELRLNKSIYFITIALIFLATYRFYISQADEWLYSFEMFANLIMYLGYTPLIFLCLYRATNADPGIIKPHSSEFEDF